MLDPSGRLTCEADMEHALTFRNETASGCRAFEPADSLPHAAP